MLKARLQELISQREEAANNIREAREFGDLKENAEYAAAREAQSILEDEIASIQNKLPLLHIFHYARANTSCVNVGTKVTIEEIGASKRKQEWTITGIIENDPSHFYISNEAPLGKALLGKKVGETVEIHTPDGRRRFKVTKIAAGA